MSSVDYIPPLGGLKQDLPAQLLPRHFTPDASGVWPVDGRIRRIFGKQKFSTTQLAGGAVMLLQQFWKEDSSNALVAVSQDKAYKYNSSTGAFDSIQDGTDFTGSANDHFSAEAFLDNAAAEILVITNYLDAMRKWTASGAISALGGTPPKAKFLCRYANYLIAGFTNESGTAYPRRVRWSALGNGESWPSDNYGDFRRTSDWLVGLRTIGPRLAVYKERSITLMDYVGGGLVFDAEENFIDGIGPLNDACIVTRSDKREEHIFIGGDLNIYAFNGIDFEAISSNIDRIVKNLHPTYKTNACALALTEENKIVWAVPKGDQDANKALIILDTKDRTFWVKDDEPVAISSFGGALLEANYTWDTLPYDTWDEWDDPEGWNSRELLENAPIPLVGCADGYVRKFVAGVNDDGSDLPSHYVYPWDNLDGEDETIKEVHKIIIEVANEGSGTITLQAYVDQDDSVPAALDEDGNTAKTINLFGDNANADYVYHEVDIAVQGYSFMWRLSSTNSVWTGRVVKVFYEVIGERIV